jgi:esterase/lipase superfamily enzyme
MRSAYPIRRGILTASLLLAALSWNAPFPASAEEQAVNREIPFLTLRNRTGSKEPGKAYGDERSDLKAGRCRVRELDLSLLTPLAETAPTYIREELLRVDEVSEADKAEILDQLQQTADGHAPVLYVHGFYISFEKGCRRAVLLQENAALEGRFLWFSWPSDGALTNYTRDEADLYWSVPDLADTIIEMEQRFGPGVVNVAGHSLGARGVVLALYEVANRNPDARLGNVVLLAPDMDFAIFERMLPRFSPIVESVTVYVTSEDKPLALSARVHGYPRLGEAGNDVSKLSGVEVIDLSDLPVNSPTGHLYHINSKDVGNDLNLLLNHGKRAAEREGLVQSGVNLWSFRKKDD